MGAAPCLEAVHRFVMYSKRKRSFPWVVQGLSFLAKSFVEGEHQSATGVKPGPHWMMLA